MGAGLAIVAPADGAYAQGTAPSARRTRFERDGIIWETRAWSIPYAENLSAEAKLAGLSRVWMEAKLNFPNFAHIADIDWDSVYISYIPRVTATTTTAEYYRTLQRMMVTLQDGHSDVFMPAEIAATLSAPPLRIDRIEQRTFITGVMSPRLEQEGIVGGLEILRIDGEPVDTYAERVRAPYATSNTPQAREVARYSRDLLLGDRDVPVRLTLRHAGGETVERTIARSGYQVSAAPRTEFRMLPGAIAYVALNTFGSDSVQGDFERLLPRIRGSRGLILDVRQNSGGSGVVAYNILGHFAADSFALPALRSRQYIATRRAWGQAGTWWSPGPQKWPGRSSERLTLPVVMLTGPRTLSAADVFAEAFRVNRMGTIIGEPTGGSTGDPLAFALPGGGVARVATSPNLGAVAPDVSVPRTAADFLAGRDAALTAALGRLRGS